ncbi:MAG: MBL fold metallo-hydrolase [Cephaloticoccus sp.]|nr:MBL fold metallo-hydrolase [Cephaloticoccus sp.]MCF7759880.1 MBL fold metallo-hydrolase [Cephaloticoccus sp.]
MTWQVKFRKGLWVPLADCWLDAQFSTPRAVVSHAHSDHVGRHKELICSPPTARLLRARLPGRRIEHVLPYGQTEALTAEVAITLHPAGHILGSSLIELRGAPGTLLYTGDFKLRSSLAAETCATPRADLLIMETTFGLPKYVFPADAEVIGKIVAFCREAVAEGRVPVLFCYSLGKTQEVLRALQPAGLPVMLHDSALRLTRIYEQFGYIFPPYRDFDANTVGGHVVICPPPQQKNNGLLRHIPARRTAMISGWALDSGATYRYRCDAAFPLSDHADFNDLIQFVEKVQPRQVLTLHGFAREFARTLRERGWDAWALGQENQLDLALGAPARN